MSVETPTERAYADDLAAAWAAVASSPQGRLVLWDVLSRCAIFATTFSESPQTAAYLEGRRSVGLELLDETQVHAPGAFEDMMASHRKMTEAMAAERAAMDEGDE